MEPNNLICKYTVKIEETFVISMPEGAVPISYKEQNGTLYVWAAVNTKNQRSWHKFALLMTGVESKVDLSLYQHVGTELSGSTVTHLFYLGQESMTFNLNALTELYETKPSHRR